MLHKHIFAVFYDELTPDKLLEIKNKDLAYRITKILRLNVGEKIILFNEHINGIYTVNSVDKNKVELQQELLNRTEKRSPQLSLYICLLKKDAFLESVRQCAAMGVSHIIPVISDKIDRNWFSNKDYNKCMRISISACEQAKNYNLPTIHQPVRLDSAISNRDMLIACPSGKPLQSIVQYISNDISVLIGPEAGFSPKEENQLKELKKISLTPTILRAVDAVGVLAGAISSILYSTNRKRL